MPDPAATLARAADLIDEHGWHQGDHVGPRGEVCCLTAVKIAVGDQHGPVYGAATVLLSGRLGRTAPDSVEAIAKIVAWNDEPGRTQAEVTAALRGDT